MQETPGLDLDRVLPWLHERTEIKGEVQACVIAGGRSNLTFLLSVDGESRYVLRRPPLKRLHPGAHNVAREYRVMDALQGHVPLPRTLGLCEDDEITGAPFYVVDFVPGRTLRTVDDACELGTPGHLAAVVGKTLGTLHRVAPAITGREPQRGWDFTARQLQVWGRQIESPDGRPLPLMLEVRDRLAADIPAQRTVAIVHGDFRLDNLRIADDGAVLAILDWELWTLGDPLADLGISLSYWLDPGAVLVPLGDSPTLASIGSRDQLTRAYAEVTGWDLEEGERAFYLAFADWRFAAILEGVYQRHLAGAYGETPGEHWRELEHIVPALAEQAAQTLGVRSAAGAGDGRTRA